jgi:hypothetical protein
MAALVESEMHHLFHVIWYFIYIIYHIICMYIYLFNQHLDDLKGE